MKEDAENHKISGNVDVAENRKIEPDKGDFVRSDGVLRDSITEYSGVLNAVYEDDDEIEDDDEDEEETDEDVD